MVIHLLQFENFAESVLQDAFARWLSGHVQLHDLAVQLTRAMEDGQRSGPRGEAQAPAAYQVYLHPDDLAALRAAQPDAEAALAQTIVAIAQRAGLTLAAQPSVVLTTRPEQARHTVAATAQGPTGEHESTLALDAADRAQLAAALKAPSAYLVVEGKRVVALNEPVVRLGRRPDNDVILDDARVSRQHAQIRYRYGHHVLYDLGSQGGSWVNGVRVSECVLSPGDVISLAGCALIYGSEDAAPPPEALVHSPLEETLEETLDRTQVFSPIEVDRLRRQASPETPPPTPTAEE